MVDIRKMLVQICPVVCILLDPLQVVMGCDTEQIILQSYIQLFT